MQIVGNFMKDKVKNDDIRKKTGLRKLEDIIKERRLRWLEHVIQTEDSRIPRQATQRELKGYKRKPGRPMINWTDIVKRNLKNMDITWEGRSQGTSDWQDRMASTCGPVLPTGRRVNRTEQNRTTKYYFLFCILKILFGVFCYLQNIFEITFRKYFTQWWGMRPHFISTVLTSTKHYLLYYWSNSENLWGLVSLCANNGKILRLHYFILYFQNTFFEVVCA